MKSKNKKEYGDFQTPDNLVMSVTEAVASRGIKPLSIVEPTCGIGNFLFGALEKFPSAKDAIALEINKEYFKIVDLRLEKKKPKQTVDLRWADFFSFNWSKVFSTLQEPILIIGNPPWITASELGALKSSNLSKKINFQNLNGFDALTGKSNFDIAEWMLLQIIECASEKNAIIAMLLKTSVARKLLFYAWKKRFPILSAGIYTFDASKHFGINASACLFVCEMKPGSTTKKCEVMSLNDLNKIDHTIAYKDGFIFSNVEGYNKHKELLQQDNSNAIYRWRSGVKHDCSKVMELRKINGKYVNGYGEIIDLENQYLYPMLKGSDVSKNKVPDIQKYMVITQKKCNDATEIIKNNAPRVWAYLCKHGNYLDRRASSIYKKRPRFSIFGIGPYVFKPWKVAICGLYKHLNFSVVGPFGNRPIVFDDTVYYISCETKKEACIVSDLLNSEMAKSFFNAFIFWDAKRPITAEILNKLDVITLAEILRKKEELNIEISSICKASKDDRKIASLF